MQIIIVGGGKAGAHLATRLSGDGAHVTVIEERPEAIERLKRLCPTCSIVEGNASNPDVLEKAGILIADALTAVTGADETNLVVSMLAKMEYSVPRVVARVNNPANAWMFTPANGVDVAINQAEITVRFIHEGMNLRDMFTLMKLGRDEHSIVQATVNPSSKVDGASLADIAFPAQTIVVAVERGDTLTVPNGRTVLHAGDEAILFCSREGRDAIRRLFA